MRKRFTTTVTLDRRGRAIIPVPFDPDAVWGPKPKHHVGGQIDGHMLRGTVEPHGDGHALVMGPMWVRDCSVRPDVKVSVTIAPEGPQRGELAPDIVAALSNDPKAAAAFDGLATFYRKGFLRWIDATKRRPEVRAQRIAEMVSLLRSGKKERPKG